MVKWIRGRVGDAHRGGGRRKIGDWKRWVGLVRFRPRG